MAFMDFVSAVREVIVFAGVCFKSTGFAGEPGYVQQPTASAQVRYIDVPVIHIAAIG